MYYRKDGNIISEDKINSIEGFCLNTRRCMYRKSINIPSITLSFVILLLVIVPMFSKSYADFLTQNNTCLGCYGIILFSVIIALITLI